MESNITQMFQFISDMIENIVGKVENVQFFPLCMLFSKVLYHNGLYTFLTVCKLIQVHYKIFFPVFVKK